MSELDGQLDDIKFGEARDCTKGEIRRVESVNVPIRGDQKPQQRRVTKQVILGEH